MATTMRMPGIDEIRRMEEIRRMMFMEPPRPPTISVDMTSPFDWQSFDWQRLGRNAYHNIREPDVWSMYGQSATDNLCKMILHRMEEAGLKNAGVKNLKISKHYGINPFNPEDGFRVECEIHCGVEMPKGVLYNSVTLDFRFRDADFRVEKRVYDMTTDVRMISPTLNQKVEECLIALKSKAQKLESLREWGQNTIKEFMQPHLLKYSENLQKSSASKSSESNASVPSKTKKGGKSMAGDGAKRPKQKSCQ